MPVFTRVRGLSMGPPPAHTSALPRQQQRLSASGLPSQQSYGLVAQYTSAQPYSSSHATLQPPMPTISPNVTPVKSLSPSAEAAMPLPAQPPFLAPTVAPGDSATAMSQHQLAGMIEQSVEYTRAAGRIRELQRHTEQLNGRLQQALHERDRAETALIEQSSQHTAAEERVRMLYEGRLGEKQREIADLKMRLQASESQGARVRVRVKGGGGRLLSATCRLWL